MLTLGWLLEDLHRELAHSLLAPPAESDHRCFVLPSFSQYSPVGLAKAHPEISQSVVSVVGLEVFLPTLPGLVVYLIYMLLACRDQRPTAWTIICLYQGKRNDPKVTALGLLLRFPTSTTNTTKAMTSATQSHESLTEGKLRRFPAAFTQRSHLPH